jgi:ABC-type polysaccharide/polyol phosphate transport system ATPase subunit
MSSRADVAVTASAAEASGAAPPSDVVLSVRDVSKVYRVYSRPHHRVLQALADRRGRGPIHCFEVPAVQEISFDLERGDAIAIIGRNGSGKSTLLELIAGTLQPTSGHVTRQGRVSALLELGAGFNPDFTGRQNFRISAAIQGLGEAEIAAVEDDVERFAEVGAFFDEPVRTYSSGMYVRVAFAAAVHMLPDLLIVDEALAVGDIFFQQKCFELMQHRLADASKLIVTHDLASAVRLSSRCLVMDRGRVVFDGPPLDAVETYTAINLREQSARTGSAAAGSDGPSGRTIMVPGSTEPAAVPDGLADVDAARSSDDSSFAVLQAGAARMNGSIGEPLDAAAPVVRPGDVLRFSFVVDIGVDVDQPVFGYLVRDRVGNALFGQNTIGSGLAVGAVRRGRQLLTFHLVWPEVEQGEYVMTIGLGDGLHPLHHRIVAWVQRVLRLVCVPLRAVHGSFNNDLKMCTVAPIAPHPEDDST